jgi:hypothetical protein
MGQSGAGGFETGAGRPPQPPEWLDRLAQAEELDLASRRDDGSLSVFTTMWVVRVGESAYVRSARGPSGAWYRRALRYGAGRVAAGGIQADVTFEQVPVDDEVHAALDTAYHQKYDRYGSQIVGTVVGPDAAAVTLRLVHPAGDRDG